jgi:hypothetical protein
MTSCVIRFSIGPNMFVTLLFWPTEGICDSNCDLSDHYPWWCQYVLYNYY